MTLDKRAIHRKSNEAALPSTLALDKQRWAMGPWLWTKEKCCHSNWVACLPHAYHPLSQALCGFPSFKLFLFPTKVSFVFPGESQPGNRGRTVLLLANYVTGKMAQSLWSSVSFIYKMSKLGFWFPDYSFTFRFFSTETRVSDQLHTHISSNNAEK